MEQTNHTSDDRRRTEKPTVGKLDKTEQTSGKAEFTTCTVISAVSSTNDTATINRVNTLAKNTTTKDQIQTETDNQNTGCTKTMAKTVKDTINELTDGKKSWYSSPPAYERALDIDDRINKSLTVQSTVSSAEYPIMDELKF